MPPSSRTLLALAASLLPASARLVTIRNDVPRLDVTGAFVDAHDGCIVARPASLGGGYLLYGESYGNVSTDFPWPHAPVLAVYYSPDLLAWSYAGPVIAHPPAPTQWIPNVVYDARSQRFILWAGSGGWFSATSPDGIHFTTAHAAQSSRLPGGTDGTGVFLDADGEGYIIFAGLPQLPSMEGHLVSIERLSPDYLTSSKVNVTGFFPDAYVESPSLFRRGATYYATYGSCCCACAGGGGQVVFTAPAVAGPWTRQRHADINCANASAPICGAFGARAGQRGEIYTNAQWWGPSMIPLVNGSQVVLFTGRRWLSGPNAPPGCDDMCGNSGRRAACTAPTYRAATDFDVWHPLSFAADGSILPMLPLPSFELDIPIGAPASTVVGATAPVSRVGVVFPSVS